MLTASDVPCTCLADQICFHEKYTTFRCISVRFRTALYDVSQIKKVVSASSNETDPRGFYTVCFASLVVLTRWSTRFACLFCTVHVVVILFYPVSRRNLMLSCVNACNQTLFRLDIWIWFSEFFFLEMIKVILWNHVESPASIKQRCERQIFRLFSLHDSRDSRDAPIARFPSSLDLRKSYCVPPSVLAFGKQQEK